MLLYKDFKTKTMTQTSSRLFRGRTLSQDWKSLAVTMEWLNVSPSRPRVASVG